MSKADELRLLRDAIKSFPDALAVWSAEGRLIACSDLYARLAAAGGENAEYQTDCRVVAQKLQQVLAAEFRVGARRLRLAASIGVSLFPADGGDGEALLRNADAAMYRAKQLGRNQVRFFGR